MDHFPEGRNHVYLKVVGSPPVCHGVRSSTCPPQIQPDPKLVHQGVRAVSPTKKTLKHLVMEYYIQDNGVIIGVLYLRG